MGAFVNPTDSQTLSTTDHENLVLQFESMIGRKLDIEMWYYRWGTSFWNGAPLWDVANGRIPEIKYGASTTPSLDSITDGSQDATLRALADGIRSLGSDVLFCPLWEMNGDWEAWSGAKTNDPGTYDGPLKYIKAWRHMHDIFVQEGATNAVWVWAPDRGDSPKENWNHWLKYYPGDTYVDWVGFDGYNWGTSATTWSSTWASFEDTFRPIYRDFAARKPIMIAETASTELGGDKAQWMADAQAMIKARWPDVVAVTWFDDNKETDWRVDSSSSALGGYKAWVHDPFFDLNGNSTVPSSLGLPAITGSPQEGKGQATDNGAWSGTPTAYSFQWKRCTTDGGACTAISGATGQAYTATSADVGATLRAFVTASNASGSATVASDPTFPVASSTPPVPAVAHKPVLLGAFEEGTTLTGTLGTWTGAPTSYSNLWRRCDAAGANCVDLTGQTTRSYTLSSADVGHRVKLRITATNGAGSGSYTVTSLLVYGPAPAPTAIPSVSGVSTVGGALTASAGSWSGSPTGYLYRWRRCGPLGASCVDIVGATGTTYTPTTADVGHTLRVEVMASNQWGSSMTSSAPTASVAST
jgi:hypothetical protein